MPVSFLNLVRVAVSNYDFLSVCISCIAVEMEAS